MLLCPNRTKREERKEKLWGGISYQSCAAEKKEQNSNLSVFQNKNFFMRQTECLSPQWPPSPASAPAVGPPRGRRRTWCPGGGRPYHRQPQPRINLRERKRKSFSFSFLFLFLCCVGSAANGPDGERKNFFFSFSFPGCVFCESVWCVCILSRRRRRKRRRDGM